MRTENHRVLIIDDERPVLMTLEALLKRHGYQVETAPTAAQGLKVLKSKSPTLVLLDLRLPDADGLEMLDRIKSELLTLGASRPHTRGIETILFHPSFPVDIRHNAKIFREKLAVWAARKAPGARMTDSLRC